ncbi:MAG: ABC transporter ATP-binding protein/permease [Bacilli bacterium]|jgi:ATP-binding cassette subfamily B protein|nr:ABC transporter ATP-binding protein/permease [Bacilli bacterium]
MSDFKTIFGFIKKDKKDFLIAVVCVVTETIFELFIPFVMAKMIDEGVKGKNLDLIYLYGGIITICAVMSLINGLLFSKFAALASARLGKLVREAQFKKIQEYSFANLDAFQPSSLLTRVINDSMAIQNVSTSLFRPLFRAPIMLILGIILPLWINWELALIFVFLSPVLALFVYLILKAVAPKYIVMQKQLDSLNGKIQETLIAIRTVKSFVRKPYECEKFSALDKEYNQTTKDVFKINNLNIPAFQFIMYAATVLFMWFGGNMIVSDVVLPGALTGILSYVMQTFNSLMMLSNAFNLLSKSLASVYRINEVLKAKPDIFSGESEKQVTDGEISFKNVSFRYFKEAKEKVLDGIDLEVAAGTTLGILGPTGSGKSTLVQLIPRLYEVSEGAVLIDGEDVRSYSLENLRSGVGMVLQKNNLFSGSIKDNLLWANPNATQAELQEVLALSASDEFVSRLPLGIDTQVGEGGSQISGGQRQRLCLARALLKKPKILILDDTTSAVDAATEKRIRTSLASLKGMTKIIISQRLLSVMEADKILILKEGKIVEIGNHESLLKDNPLYQDLYNAQLKGVLENG